MSQHPIKITWMRSGGRLEWSFKTIRNFAPRTRYYRDAIGADGKWINGRPTASLFNHTVAGVRRLPGQLRLWPYGFTLLDYPWCHIAINGPTGDAHVQ